jgi:threonine/homoserine/homoserine lactone efflux protein
VLVTHFIQGAAAGFLLAIPVGPVALICIRQALLHGLLCGFLTGMGAAGADALFGYLAAYGVSALSETVVWHSHSVRLVGGALLLLFGIVVFRQKTLDRRGRQPRNLLGSALATFLLTVSNPAVLLAFGAIFAALGIAHEPMSEPRVAALVLGVFSGSCTWWLSLAGLSELFRNRLTLDLLLRVNRVLGFLIGGIGLAAMASSLAF